MIFYVIDRRFPKSFKIPGNSGKDFLYNYVDPGQKMSLVVYNAKRSILDSGLGQKSVDMIRLCGHGNTGFVQIGEGLTPKTAVEFKDLAAFMKANLYDDGIQIHGCGVASSSNILGAGSTITNPVCVAGTNNGNSGNGYNLLKTLANAVGRNVTAGLNCQYVDDDWKFEGPTLTVNPGGSSALVKTL